MHLFEVVADGLTRGRYSDYKTEAAAAAWHNGYLSRENVALKESSGANDILGGGGWQDIGGNDANEPTRDALKHLIERARHMARFNSLIKRAGKVRAFYTFAQGVTLSSPDKKAASELADFWSDLDNAWFCDPVGLAALDIELTNAGNVFLVFYADRKTGRTVVRFFPVEEISDVIRSDEDRFAPQLYTRTYIKRVRSENGQISTKPVTELYPDWRHNPASKPATIDDKAVNWDVQVLHIKSGGELVWKFGLPLHLAGMEWAKGYSGFLKDRATVASTLAKFVLKARSAAKSGLAGVKKRVTSALRPESSEDAAGARTDGAGGVALLGEGADIEALGVKGATIHPDEGRRLMLMAACDAGLPETMYGDVSVGTLATATSLDQPTKLMFELHRGLWARALTTVALIVLINAARAKRNGLRLQYRATTPQIVNGRGKAITIDVDYPPLLQHEVGERMTAIDKAAKYLPGLEGRKQLARFTLAALNENDVETLISKLDFSQPDPAAPTDKTGDKTPDPAKTDPKEGDA